MATSARTPNVHENQPENKPAASKRCRCPRCRYDLSGETDTWPGAGRCPVDGVCPECGLTFAWCDLFRPNISPGYIESEERLRVRWMVRTYLRALMPWSFWRWVRMEVAPRPLRLASLVVFTLSLVPLVGVLPLFIAGVSSRLMNSQVPFFSQTRLVYGPAATRGELWSRAVFEGGIATAYPASGTMHAWSLSRALAEGDYLVWPPIGCMLVPTLMMPFMYLIMTGTRSRARVSAVHIRRVAALSLVGPAFVMTVLWASFAVPIFAYTGVGRVHNSQGASTALWISARWWSDLYDWSTDVIRAGAPLLALATGVWVLMFYGFAGSRYMRLPRPWTVALVNGIPVALTSLIAVLALWVVDSYRP